MAVPQTSSRQAWAQAYAQNPENGHIKAECQHANFLRVIQTITAEAGGGAAANTRNYSVQVADLYGTAILERFHLRLKIEGAIAGTFALLGGGATGTIERTVKANEEYDLLTDANGVVTFSILSTGVGAIFTTPFVAENIPECNYVGAEWRLWA